MGFLSGMRRPNQPRRKNPEPVTRHLRPVRQAEPHGTTGFAVIDVETTGFSARLDRIVDIGVVLTDEWGAVQFEWASRVNPQRPMGATHIHGITQQDVADAPVFAQVVSHLAGLLRGRSLVAHNAAFDVQFLKYEFGRANWAWPEVPSLCTLRESSYYLPHLDRRRLSDCCHACDISLAGAHTALGDARATATLLRSYLTPAQGRAPKPDHLALPSHARGVEWPTQPGQTTRDAVIADPDSQSAHPAPTSRAAYRATAAVTNLLERLALGDVIDAGAPAHSAAYLELLIAAIEDGEVSDAERTALQDLAEASGLSWRQVGIAHEAFAFALADEALKDGTVQRAERSELKSLLQALGLDAAQANTLLREGEEHRFTVLSEGLPPLPPGWPHGEPLRVGDRVAFTGCAESDRAGLEEHARTVGIRVTGSVSRKTAFLVSDGTVKGNKTDAAAALSIRVVHPATFAILLTHIQPQKGPAVHSVGGQTPQRALIVDAGAPG